MEEGMVRNRWDNISPAFSEDNIAVVFEVSKAFAPYLSIAVLSVIAASDRDHNYDIIILSNELDGQDRNKLRSLCGDRANICIRFFDPSHMVKRYVETAENKYLEINYYRMLLPWILENYERAINLGADVLVKRDVAELFYTRMDEKAYIGGAMDLGYHGRLSLDISPKELGLKDPYAYINADVLLLELKKIRDDFSQDEIMESWQKKRFRCAEQDAFNWLFQEHIHQLDLRWNVFPRNMSSEFDVMHARKSDIRLWEKSLNDPYIIHYAAAPKPWQVPAVGYGAEWWYMAKESPYYEEIVRSMCRYIDGHGVFQSEGTGGLAEKVLPYGSLRRKAAKRIAPKGSKRWILLKRVYHALGGSEH